jgi:Na+/phosphate symporter
VIIGSDSTIAKEEQAMKTIFKKLETMFAAAAFAEEGEHETARQLMSEKKDLRKTDRPSLRDSKRSAARPTLRVD